VCIHARTHTHICVCMCVYVCVCVCVCVCVRACVRACVRVLQGKSTALKVLAGKMKPNLGRFDNAPDWSEILAYFRGSELQTFFTRILEDTIKAIIKPQYVDHIPRAIKGIVGEILTEKNDNQNKDYLLDVLDLHNVVGRGVQDLSGGELQRFAIAVVAVQKADVFMFDEPSSYLDVKQACFLLLT